MIRVEQDGAIVTVTLDAPERSNAIDLASMERLGAILDDVEDRDDVRCVVITGAGGCFSAGADLPERGKDGMGDSSAVMAAVSQIIDGLAHSRLPIVAKVDGAAAGVAASIAFACDIVIASEEAFFLMPFLPIALVPDGGATLTIAASIGRARAMRMALLGERLEARHALEAGLVAEVWAREQLDARVLRVARMLEGGPSVAIARTKALINESTLATLGKALEREAEEQLPLLASPEFAEGVAAFRERRRPQFSGATG